MFFGFPARVGLCQDLYTVPHVWKQLWFEWHPQCLNVAFQTMYITSFSFQGAFSSFLLQKVYSSRCFSVPTSIVIGEMFDAFP